VNIAWYDRAVRDILVRVFGWRALFVHGDPLTTDRFLWIKGHLGESVESDRRPLTLDAGCGNGGFAIYAASAGHEVLGISDSDQELSDAQRRAQIAGVDHVRFVAYDLREFNHFDGNGALYDNVICLEVIEHVLDDVGLLRSLAARTRVGGRLFLTTPTAEHSPLHRESVRVSEVEDGSHVRYGYSPRELRRVIEEAGFAVQELDGVGGILMQKVTSWMRRLGEVNGGLAWLLTFPLRLLRIVDPLVTRNTSAAHLSYGVVATKLGGA
jgi:2-polyprenyl-3-methyl-5-hydroxy-6-metoxy-1,4-benzoquinol methylase